MFYRKKIVSKLLRKDTKNKQGYWMCEQIQIQNRKYKESLSVRKSLNNKFPVINLQGYFLAYIWTHKIMNWLRNCFICSVNFHLFFLTVIYMYILPFPLGLGTTFFDTWLYTVFLQYYILVELLIYLYVTWLLVDTCFINNGQRLEQVP